MKKIIILLSLTLTLNPFTVFASVNTPVNTVIADSVDQEISPISDIIGWRYKTINGKIYKRQYNYSKEKWIGEWEAC